MSGRTKGLKIRGQHSLDPVVIAAAASAIPAPLHPNFHQVVEALPAAVYVTDAEGRITYYNKAAVELWGYRPTLSDSRWCGVSLGSSARYSRSPSSAACSTADHGTSTRVPLVSAPGA